MISRYAQSKFSYPSLASKANGFVDVCCFACLRRLASKVEDAECSLEDGTLEDPIPLNVVIGVLRLCNQGSRGGSPSAKVAVSAATVRTLQCVEPLAGLVCSVVRINCATRSSSIVRGLARTHVVVQAGGAPHDEPRAPLAHRGLGQLQALSDGIVGFAFGAAQNNAGPLAQRSRQRAAAHKRLKLRRTTIQIRAGLGDPRGIEAKCFGRTCGGERRYSKPASAKEYGVPSPTMK